MNKKSTKRALLTSILSMVLCLTMLIGTTFAWFTDTVTSGGNKIQAGNLDVQLLMNTGSGYTDISDSTSPIFGKGDIAQNNNAATLWEPGKTQVAYLAIKNNGSLDLEYKVDLIVKNSVKNLHEAMQYAIIRDAQYNTVTAWDATKAVNIASTGVLETEAVNVSLEKGATHYFALAVHMKEEAGNEYQGGSVEFDMVVNATQLSSESDSFDATYDENATMPVTAYASEPVSTTGVTTIHAKDKNNQDAIVATFEVPSAAVEDDATKIEVSVTEADLYENITIATDEKAETFEVKVTGIRENNTTPVSVSLNVGTGLSNVRVYHYATEITPVTYDSNTGKVHFTTTEFSPFTVVSDVKLSEENDETETPDQNELPTAIVTNADQYEGVSLKWESYGEWTPSNPDQKLESAYIFKSPHDSETVVNNPYKDWYCDYYVKMNRDVPAGSVFLGGNYGSFGWIGFENPEAVKANEEIPLLGAVTKQPWTYERIVSFVGEFTCGVAHLDESLDGATFTVMLRLTNPDDANDFHNVNEVTYTFPSLSQGE